MVVTCEVPSPRGSKPGMVSVHSFDYEGQNREKIGLAWKIRLVIIIYERVSFAITCEKRKLPTAVYLCVVCALYHRSVFTLCAPKGSRYQ